MQKLIPLMAAAALLCAAPLTRAQAPKIAVVDAGKIFQESIEGKKTAQALQTRIGTEEAKLQNEQAALKAMYEDMQKKKDSLSPEALAEKEAEIESRDRKFKGMYQSTGQRLEALQQRTTGAFRVKLFEFLARWAKQNGYAMVMLSDATIYVDSTMDITDAALKGFNEEYIKAGQPEVKLPDEMAAAPAAAPAPKPTAAPAPKPAAAPKKKP